MMEPGVVLTRQVGGGCELDGEKLERWWLSWNSVVRQLCCWCPVTNSLTTRIGGVMMASNGGWRVRSIHSGPSIWWLVLVFDQMAFQFLVMVYNGIHEGQLIIASTGDARNGQFWSDWSGACHSEAWPTIKHHYGTTRATPGSPLGSGNRIPRYTKHITNQSLSTKPSGISQGSPATDSSLCGSDHSSTSAISCANEHLLTCQCKPFTCKQIQTYLNLKAKAPKLR